MKIAAEGEPGIARCASCMNLFEYIGDGKSMPVDCPACSLHRQQQIAAILQREQELFDEIEKLLMK